MVLDRIIAVLRPIRVRGKLRLHNLLVPRRVVKPLRAALRALLLAWRRTGRAPGWYYQVVERWGHHLSEPKGIPATLVNGARVLCDLTDHVERQMFFNGLYEPIEAYLLSRLLEPGMTMIDGGANVGAHTLIAASAVGPNGTVHCFEPVPRTFEKLKAHVARNALQHVRVNRAALWGKSATLSLGLTPDNTGNVGAFGVAMRDSVATVEAPALRLDDYVDRERIERIDLIKLDLEGAELPALQGMRTVLERNHPLLLVEICEATCARLGYEPQAIWELLARRLGYRGWAIAESSSNSRSVTSLRGIKQQNVLFYVGDLPGAMLEGWDLKSVLRWARGHTR